ncbi:hypothetical protein SAMN05660909_02590 [Chitinophaga terrae (ex Kim and Jung 2007)]|uniref:Uncharacterized protein n=1 Tax=Chitinophaga terrae (ex Kim and Jung 2007) TaxID=408074 RepID=A0A1H4CFD6_9BACT|nr:hypothetical protein SAMN05660909_02590 [Chitinophaga terrae (ex Kim and Jung 2007)]
MITMTFKNVLLFVFLKYLVFYSTRMIEMNDYRILRVWELRSITDWYYYLWMVMFLPAVSIMLFSAPIYFSFRIKNIFLFAFAVLAIFTAEYFMYVSITSERHIDGNGMLNGIIGILLFILFFYKKIGKICNISKRSAQTY